MAKQVTAKIKKGLKGPKAKGKVNVGKNTKRKPKQKKKTAPNKNPNGRPTKYKEKYIPIVRKLAAMGLTRYKIAEYLRIGTTTQWQWMVDHPEFAKAFEAKKVDQIKAVRTALKEKALGYSHDSVHVSSHEGKVTLTPITKHYPPDTKAATEFLRNEDPENWKESQEGKPQTIIINRGYRQKKTAKEA